MVEAKVWVLKRQCEGEPKVEDFECKTEILTPCEDGEIVFEAEWLSVDPYNRYKIKASNVGDTIFGSQVGKIIESRNADYSVGTYVVAYPGWRSHTKFTKEQTKDPFMFKPIPDLKGQSRSTCLGILGMPGVTAYFGLLDICDPKAGETVLVNGAAGAVGSAVCQIAKIKGCRVIAFAGGAAKVDYIKSLGIELAYDYKTEDVGTVLKAQAPKGVNCFFDNVGGEFTARAMPHMANRARISLCGAISTYNDVKQEGPHSGPFDSMNIISKELRIEGFMVYRYTERWTEAVSQLAVWIKEGKLKYEETVTEGIRNMPKAFIGLFHGDNVGKAVIKC